MQCTGHHALTGKLTHQQHALLTSRRHTHQVASHEACQRSSVHAFQTRGCCEYSLVHTGCPPWNSQRNSRSMTLPLWQASMMQCILTPCGSGFTRSAFSSLSMSCPACTAYARQSSVSPGQHAPGREPAPSQCGAGRGTLYLSVRWVTESQTKKVCAAAAFNISFVRQYVPHPYVIEECEDTYSHKGFRAR